MANVSLARVRAQLDNLRTKHANKIEHAKRGFKTAGDALVMADGEWKDQTIVFRAKGTPGKPITLKAATPGKVILSGASTLSIEGEYLVVSGLYFKGSTAPGDTVAIKGNHNRLTDTAVVDCASKFFVHMFGTDNQLDRCYLAGKTTVSPTLQIEAPGEPNRHRIERNHFGPRPPLRRNGGETIRVGYSWQSMNSSATLVEQNLFDRCDGEIEIISSKSCDNIYRGNTFLDCAGMFTLRHGNRCLVEDNYFLGHHKRGSGGIRVIGEDHTIINNYIDGVEDGAFWITAGIPGSPLNGYFRSKNCLIAFNTVVDTRGPILDTNAGLGTSRRTLRPENITIANNLLSPAKDAQLIKGTEGEGWKWQGNLVAPPTDAPGDAAANGTKVSPHEGVQVVDLKLLQGKDGLWRPGPGSPALGGAEGDFPQVKTDIEGRPRAGKLNVGCDQPCDKPATIRPLTAADVGPEWMDRGK
jgi:poly(beta-D-mannuronate) lyase